MRVRKRRAIANWPATCSRNESEEEGDGLPAKWSHDESSRAELEHSSKCSRIHLLRNVKVPLKKLSVASKQGIQAQRESTPKQQPPSRLPYHIWPKLPLAGAVPARHDLNARRPPRPHLIILTLCPHRSRPSASADRMSLLVAEQLWL
jgi:hypothetical protein